MKVFYFDLETSGTDEKKHGILQLAYIVEIDGVVKEEGELFCNPIGKEIDDEALAINHIKKEDIQSFSKPELFKKKLESILGKYVNKFDKNDKFTISGYNVDFDIRFLKTLWEEQGDTYFYSWFKRDVLDPYLLILFLTYAQIPALQQLENKKLITVAEALGCVEADDNFHDAKTDIRVTRRILLCMKDFNKNLI